MKTILKTNITLIFSIFFLFIAFVNVNAQENGQWDVLNAGEFGTIDFVNENIGWSAGYGGLLKTEDGGVTWFSILPEGYSEIRSIDFVNESLGWAIGSGIYKTMDGGLTWVIQNEPEAYLNSLHVVNDSTVYVGADSSLILKTIDGGLKWHDISLINKNYELLEILFINDYTGLILGYDPNNHNERPIFRTIDGGNTWQTLPHFNYIFLGSLQFINDSTGYILSTHLSTDQQWDKYYILETKDTCSSWSIKTQRESRIGAFKFLSNDTVFAIIWDEGNSNLMRSIDAGITWEKLYINDMSIESLYFNRNKVGFALARIGTGFGIRGRILFRTNDNGDSWVKKIISYPFKDVFFINNNTGFAVGGRIGFHGTQAGELLFTTDGGKTWSINNNHPEGLINTCIFVNDSIGFTVGNQSGREYSVVYKSTDIGNSWGVVSPPDSIGFSWGIINDICFVDAQNGWFVGSYNDTISSGAAIFSTNDNGENWNREWNYPNSDENQYFLNSIHAVNKTVWAVGEGGMLVKYTEQDQWQLQPSTTDLVLKNVFFSDEEHGWIAGGYFDDDNEYLILLKTTDGGENWQEIQGFDYQINDMFFEDSLHGWAVGNDTSYSGMILETLDGGDNWNPVVEDLSASLTALHFKDGYGWAVGGNGLVLRTEDGSTWIDENNGKTYPNKFSLSQNYPNPFNPSTTISWQLTFGSDVDLSIYNILGEKVTNLVAERQKAGYYRIVWDASGFASGVYFYRLSAEGKSHSFVNTKKLVVLK